MKVILQAVYWGMYIKVKNKEKINDMEDYWYKIKYRDTEGWVYGYFLVVEEPIKNLKGTVNINNVHVRKEFGLGTEIICKVFKGDKFTIVAKTDKPLPVEDKKNFWYKILLPDNTYGWIFGEFLDLSTR